MEQGDKMFKFVKNKKGKIVLLVLLLLALLVIDLSRFVTDFKNMSQDNWGWPDNPIQATYRDLEYGKYNDEPLLLDLYLPEDNQESYPLIVFVHGGGWMVGSKELIEPGVFELIDQGYAVASIGYSLVDKAQWPVQGQEIKGAIRWLRANADKYNLDSDKFISFGGSAGGHLSSFLGTTNGTDEFDIADYGNMEYSSDVQASVAWYPVNDILQKQPFSVLYMTVANNNSSHSGGTKLLGGKPKDNVELAQNASPIYHISKETTVPFLLMHGEKDMVVNVEQSRAFYDELQTHGIYSEYYEYEDFTHVDMRFNEKEKIGLIIDFIENVTK